jgi:hypothetical protein
MKWLDTAAVEGVVATAEAVAVVAEAVADIATPTALPWAVDAGGKPGQTHLVKRFYHTVPNVSTAFPCSLCFFRAQILISGGFMFLRGDQ